MNLQQRCLILVIFLIGGLINPVFLVSAELEPRTVPMASRVSAWVKPPNYQPGEILIKLKNSAEVYKFKFEAGADLEKIISDFQKNPAVKYAELNYKFTLAAFPNDPDYSQQWYLPAILARDGWSEELVVKEGKKVKESIIAIMDSGTDINHQDLKDNIWVNADEISGDRIDNDRNGYVDDVFGWDFVTEVSLPTAKFEPGYTKEGIHHGTMVAGIAAASGHNQQGITGVSWHAKIMSLRVLNSQGSGTAYDVYRAINYAIDNKADIINMSFIGFDYSQVLADALRKAADLGITLVAAAGNTNPKIKGVNLQEKKVYPVCYDANTGSNFIVGVASVGKNKKKSDFSNFGNDCVDIAAPGEDFYSALVYNLNYSGFDKYYGSGWSGTSLSTPLISGTAAIIKSLRPDFNNQQIIKLILESAQDISQYNPDYQGSLGNGELNAYQAVLDTINYQKKQAMVVKSQNIKIVAGLGFGSFPQLKIFDSDFSVFKEFFAYSPNFLGGVNVALADLNADGVAEIITGAGPGGGPHVRIFDQDGKVLGQFFAFDKNWRSGVKVAAADVNGDGKPEIIASPGPGTKPEIRIFTVSGQLLSSFLVYSPNFLGGVNVAVADLNNDGFSEIITGAGPGGGPHVRIFSGDGKVLGQFFAFNQNFKGGVNVAAGDVNGDKIPEIVSAVEQAATPTVRIFKAGDFKLLGEFFAFTPDFFKGVNLAVSDLNADGIAEIIAGKGVGGDSQVKIFSWQGKVLGQFFAHSAANYQGGVRVAGVR